MRVLLILASDNTYRHGAFFYNKSLYAPLTLSTLAALVPSELEAEITLIDEGVQRLDYQAAHYDVVGITFTASAAPRAYELAAGFRARGSLVVLGGPHATLNPEEAAEHGVVVAGYAEEAWPELLRRHRAGQPLERIYRAPVLPKVTVEPRRDLIPGGIYLTKDTVIASRGCVRRCEFCAIHAMYGSDPGARPVGEVVDEIKRLQAGGARKILFLDPNLINNRREAKELFSALIPLGIKWRGLATIDFVDDEELLELVVRSGCYGLLFGFETMSQANMSLSNKQFAKVAAYKDTVARLHERAIRVLGCFVLGFDEDTPDTFEGTISFLEEIQVDLVRFACLTPYPGTELFARLDREGRILTRDWSLYDTEHVVFQPAQMSPEELQEGYRRTWREWYTLRRIGRRALWRGLSGDAVTSLLGNLIFKYHFPTSKHRKAEAPPAAVGV